MEKPRRRQLITALASGLVCATVLSQIPKPALASAPPHVTESANWIDFPSLSSLTPSQGRLASEYDAGGIITNLVYCQDNTNIRYLRTEQAASYVIFIDTTDSNMIKARNGTTGKIDHSGTDATTIINDAISAVTNGGKVLIKAGTYTLTAKLAPTTSNIELCGEGFASILKLGNSVNDRNLYLAGVSNWHIHDLAFDGNRTNQDSTADPNAQNCFVIQCGSCDNIVVEKCYVHDARNMGIQCFTCTNIRISDNYVMNCDSNGIQIQNTSGGSNSIVEHNIVNGTSDVGIGTVDAIECVISDNEAYNPSLGLSAYGVNSSWGIALEALSSGNIRIGIEGNTVNGGPIVCSQATTWLDIIGNKVYNITQLDNAHAGISILQGSHITVVGNVIDTIVAGGILLTPDNGTVSHVTISSNVISNIGAGHYEDGIQAYACSYLTIFGNTIYNVTNAGIRLSGQNQNCTITGNLIDTAVNSNSILVDNGGFPFSDYITITNNVGTNCHKNAVGINNKVGVHVSVHNNVNTDPVGKITNPFGATIPNPFLNSSGDQIGVGGSASNFTSGTTYTVNIPVDVTITA